MAYLLDTNVISELRKPRVSPAVAAWIESSEIGDLRTTTANLAELSYGAALVQDPVLRNSIEDWIEHVVRPWFGKRVHDVSERVLYRWLLVLRSAQKERAPTPYVDLLIAAVALQSGHIIATRDVSPFVSIGIPTFNPFTGERFNGA